MKCAQCKKNIKRKPRLFYYSVFIENFICSHTCYKNAHKKDDYIKIQWLDMLRK